MFGAEIFILDILIGGQIHHIPNQNL